MKHVTSVLGFWAVSVLCAAMMLVPACPALGQTQTPGQITQFDPSLNVVDSVITQDQSGNIGIGTTTPATKLDMAGGNLNLENSSELAGNVLKGGVLFLHNFGQPFVLTNTFLGRVAGNLSMTGQGNTGTGAVALGSTTSGDRNTATGVFALSANTAGSDNTASGAFALQNNSTGINNSAFGSGALQNNTGGIFNDASDNTAVGANALFSNTTGQKNTASGAQALFSNTGVSGTALGCCNTASGSQALFGNTTGWSNTAVGEAALHSNTGGNSNTAVGAGADVSNGNVYNATAIGAYAIVDAPNKIRLGDISVTVIEGQVPYTFTSDKNQKESFHSVDGEEVLRKIGWLSLTSWNYRGHDPQQFRHYGPVAQEFFAAFGHDGVGTIGTPTTINSGDLEGILLIAVQALERRTAENAELKARIEALERLVKGIQSADQR